MPFNKAGCGRRLMHRCNIAARASVAAIDQGNMAMARATKPSGGRRSLAGRAHDRDAFVESKARHGGSFCGKSFGWIIIRSVFARDAAALDSGRNRNEVGELGAAG